MEYLKNLKIFIKDSKKTENRYNKNLFEFLNNNVEEIVDSGYYIRLILIDNSNITKFMKLGIKSTPALLDENENITITGVEDIIKYIISKCENWEEPNQCPAPVEKKKTIHARGTDELHSYFMNEVMQNDTKDEPIDINKVKNYEDLYNKNKDKALSKKVNANKNIINTIKNNTGDDNNGDSIENENSDVSNFINSSDEVTSTKKISLSVYDDDPDVKKFWDNLETKNY